VPGWLKRLRLRVRATFSANHDRELRDELSLHLRLLEEDYTAQGIAPAAARARARRDFGNPAVIRDASHDIFAFRLVEDLVHDVRYASREMRRTPGFTAVAVLSLAIGVGAVAATFAVVDAVMLRDLPVRDAQRLVALASGPGGDWRSWSYAAFTRWRNDPDGVLEVAAASDVLPIDLPSPGGSDLEEVRVGLVSTNYFRVMGADIARGRSFDDRDHGTPVAVVSDAFWRRRFDRDGDQPAATVELQGARYAVVGVAGKGFTGHTVGYPVDVWIPLTMQPALMPGRQGLLDEQPGVEPRWLKVIARLSESASVERAEAWGQLVRQRFLELKATRLGADSAEVARDRKERVTLLPAAGGDGAVRQRFARPLQVLSCITALVFLVACTNFANLMSARSERRRREFAIRLALGGARSRIVRQTATECAVLAVAAGLLGVMFAQGAAAAPLDRLAGMILPVDFALDVNARVLSLALACIGVAVIFGLLPCVRSAGAATTTLPHATRGSWSQPGPRRLGGRTMLIAQLAMCTVLLIGTGLLVRTVVNLRSQDLGFDRNVLLISLAPARANHSMEGAAARVREIRQRVSIMPGVDAAGVSGSALMDYTHYWIDGSQRLFTDRGEALAGARWTFAAAGPGFFEAVGMSIVRGRTFDASDADGNARTVVINQAIATFLFANEDPIGRWIKVGPKDAVRTIVGVVNDVKQTSPRDRGMGVVYVPLESYGNVMLAVRTNGAPSAAAAAIRQQVAATAGDIPIGRARTISDVLDGAIGEERLMSAVSIVLALLAVSMGCVGLYALMAYNVTRRTHELGVRVALGATTAQVVSMVLRDGAAALLPALAIGIPVGVVASRLLSSQLYGVDVGDPWSVLSAGAVLSIVALAAAVRPARTASRIDPIALLRNE
jgi:predicted permease